jgi:sec-independent protein translocase protein TatB
MFDIAWSELLVIAVVAIIVVGPKDLPRLMRTFGHYAGKLRRAAADFQRQFDEAMRETEAAEVRKAIESMRAATPSLDLKAPIDKPMMLPKEPPPPSPAAPSPTPPPPSSASVAPSPAPAQTAIAAPPAVPPPVEPPVEPAKAKPAPAPKTPAPKTPTPKRATAGGGKAKTSNAKSSGAKRRKAETEPGP